MRFRKKPVVIDAWKWDETEAMLKELKFNGMPWCSNIGHRDRPGWVGKLRIGTLEGAMEAGAGDWIIKGVAGEFYPCKPDIFAATYEGGMICPNCEAIGPGSCVRLNADLNCVTCGDRFTDAKGRILSSRLAIDQSMTALRQHFKEKPMNEIESAALKYMTPKPSRTRIVVVCCILYIAAYLAYFAVYGFKEWQ